MKIDIFTHILPPKYKAAFFARAPSSLYLKSLIETLPTLFDIEHRFRIMDKYDGLRQVLTISLPPIEQLVKAEQAVDIAKSINNELAELVQKHPDRFIAAVACLPLNDIDATLKEIDRAIKDLKLKGIQLFTTINNKPLDSTEFMPIYEKMAHYDLPIWLHPMRSSDFADYKSENRSKYMIYNNFGWPYETSVAMTRLIFSRVLEKYPGLKIITHHCGGMVPYFEQRTISTYKYLTLPGGADYSRSLSKPVIDYFKMFYADTALQGNVPALMCGYACFGAHHMVFGTDFPYPGEFGDRFTRRTIESVEKMSITKEEKNMIFEDNARKLLYI